jgi:hypothetical protein
VSGTTNESKDGRLDDILNDQTTTRLAGVPYAYLADMGASIASDYGMSMEHASQKANVDRLLAKISADDKQSLVPPSLLLPSQWTSNAVRAPVTAPISLVLPPDLAISSPSSSAVVASVVPMTTVATPATVVDSNSANISEPGAPPSSSSSGVGGSSSSSGSTLLLALPPFLVGLSSAPFLHTQPSSTSSSSIGSSPVISLPSLSPSNNEWLSPSLSSLQSPALAVAALSSPSYDSVVRTQLDSYLNSVTPLYSHLPSSNSTSTSTSAVVTSPSSGMVSPASSSASSSIFNFDNDRQTLDGKRRAIRTAFDHYSVLNLNVQPLLRKYSSVLHDLQRCHDGIPIGHEQLSAVARLPALTEQLARAVQGRQQQQIRAGSVI